MGKFKLVFYYSSMILWLELCVVVFGVEIGGFVVDYFNIFIEVCYFYIDSWVVLGYIYNESWWFYVYVVNRVDRIRRVIFLS